MFVLAIDAQAAHEGLVDLQHVDGKAPQVAEAGVAGAEIVQGQADAHGLDLLQGFHGFVDVLHQHAFGDFQFQLGGRQAGVLEDGGQVVDEVPLAKVDRRDVHRHAQGRQAHLAPGLGLCTGLAQYPLSQAYDQAAVFGDRNKLRRADPTRLRSKPACQRFRTDDAPGLQRQLGLVMQHKLIAVQRLADRAFQVLLVLGAQVHVFGVKAEIPRAAFFAGAHRGFSVLEQAHGVVAVIGVNTDAQAGAHTQVMPRDMASRADGIEYLLRNVLGLLGMLDIVKQHHELVGAITKHRIRRPHRRHQAQAHLCKHLVAGRIAQGVVDALEAVEPQKHHRQLRVVPAGQGDRLGQAVAQQRAVGQLRQGVVLQ